MKTEEKFREGLKELAETSPLDEINVVRLCRAVGSNRQTFYYHFRDIYDVVSSILLAERIVPPRGPLDVERMIKAAAAHVGSNERFLSAVGRSSCSDLLVENFRTYFYRNVQALLKEGRFRDVGDKLRSEIARLVSTLFAGELAYWLVTKRKETVHSLVARLTGIYGYFTETYLPGRTGKTMMEAQA